MKERNDKGEERIISSLVSIVVSVVFFKRKEVSEV